MVLNAPPKNNREEVDANASNSKIHTSSQRAPADGGGANPLSPAFTLQSLLDSTHSELPVFTILYNKYSDVIL